jgi:hypothetical protein
MRNLKQDSGAVACGLVGAGCSAMVEVNQDFLAVIYYGVVCFATDIYNSADTATVMLGFYFV